MQTDVPETASCCNCRKVADHIRTWTFQITPEDRDKFWYEEDIGPWQDFLDAQHCSNCANLVRVFARPDYSRKPAGTDLMQFCGDMKFNSFELRRVCDTPHSRDDSTYYFITQYPHTRSAWPSNR